MELFGQPPWSPEVAGGLALRRRGTGQLRGGGSR
jgi:hypothetical protein